MQNLPPPEHWYPLGEFLEDTRACTEEAGPEFVQHLFARYPDTQIRMFRLPRLNAAMKYLYRNRAELDRGSLAVVGKDGAIFTERVFVALWIHWGRPEIDPKTYDPPIAEFIHTCEHLPGDTQLHEKPPESGRNLPAV